jgi:hypothetical protein
MYGWLFAVLLVIGVVLWFGGMMELCVIKRTRSWKVGGGCLLAGAIMVAAAILVERSILGM